MAIDFAAIIEEVLLVETQEAEREGEDLNSKPKPGATEADIAKAEATRDRKFPKAYRDFLKTCDGWENFSWGMQLFGTDDFTGDSYDDAEETMSYTEDAPAEIEAALIIGASEDDATLSLLLESGEVVEHLYEEVSCFPDLGAYLLDRKTTLLEMREDAARAVAATEREWSPAFRTADDAALVRELQELLSAAQVVAVPKFASLQKEGASTAAKPEELIVTNEEGEVFAAAELGLVLYLGAAPSREETLEAFRAFRRAFSFEGPQKWCLADSMVFSMNECDDLDAEPFAEALRVDDQGFFGLRVQGGDEDHGSYILNLRGLPAEQDHEAEEDTSKTRRRASFVEVLVPVSEDPHKLESLCNELANILPIRSGHGGYFARVLDQDIEPDPWTTVFGWCRRYFTIEPSYVDGWLTGALTRHRGAGWLTVLGTAFMEALGDFEISDSVKRTAGKHATVLRAGELTLGDVQQGEFPLAIAEVARLIDPVSITSWAKSGTLHIAGNWFSTFSTQLPGAFGNHHATESFVRRWVDPASFVAPSAREQGLHLIGRLRENMDQSDIEEWSESSDLDDLEGFQELLHALYNGSNHAKDKNLAIEALAHAARYPGWAPPQTYNNLLNAYFSEERQEEAMALMDVALETARNEDNVFTYHAAACTLVRAGQLDRAMECVVLAKETDYEHMDKLIVDEDLKPLFDRDDWKVLFHN